MDIGGPTVQAASPAPVAQTGFGGAMDLLGGGLDSLVIISLNFDDLRAIKTLIRVFKWMRGIVLR
jgi:hypothetical protein